MAGKIIGAALPVGAPSSLVFSVLMSSLRSSRSNAPHLLAADQFIDFYRLAFFKPVYHIVKKPLRRVVHQRPERYPSSTLAIGAGYQTRGESR